MTKIFKTLFLSLAFYTLQATLSACMPELPPDSAKDKFQHYLKAAIIDEAITIPQLKQLQANADAFEAAREARTLSARIDHSTPYHVIANMRPILTSEHADSQSQPPASESHASAEAIKLIEVSGGRERAQASIAKLVQHCQDELRSNCPKCDPALITEWGKRMTAGLNIDDIVNLAATAYSKHYSEDELKDLTSFATAKQSGKPASLSPALQKKVQALKPTISEESESSGREFGEKVNRAVGVEMQKEHPEDFPTEKSTKAQP